MQQGGGLFIDRVSVDDCIGRRALGRVVSHGGSRASTKLTKPPESTATRSQFMRSNCDAYRRYCVQTATALSPGNSFGCASYASECRANAGSACRRPFADYSFKFAVISFFDTNAASYAAEPAPGPAADPIRLATKPGKRQWSRDGHAKRGAAPAPYPVARTQIRGPVLLQVAIAKHGSLRNVAGAGAQQLHNAALAQTGCLSSVRVRELCLRCDELI